MLFYCLKLNKWQTPFNQATEAHRNIWIVQERVDWWEELERGEWHGSSHALFSHEMHLAIMKELQFSPACILARWNFTLLISTSLLCFLPSFGFLCCRWSFLICCIDIPARNSDRKNQAGSCKINFNRTNFQPIHPSCRKMLWSCVRHNGIS